MIIIGGLGSIFGSFAGAAFHGPAAGSVEERVGGTGLGWPTDLAAHLEFMIVGGVDRDLPDLGAAWSWRSFGALTKEKLRLWPFPH